MNGHRRRGKQESIAVRVPYADNCTSLTVVIFFRVCQVEIFVHLPDRNKQITNFMASWNVRTDRSIK